MILEGDIGPYGPIVMVTVVSGALTVTGKAILDTGATASHVGEDAAKRIGAPRIGVNKRTGTCGACELGIYKLGFSIGGVLFKEDNVLGNPNLVQPIVALIGRDFLDKGILHCDGPKKRYRFEMALP